MSKFRQESYSTPPIYMAKFTYLVWFDTVIICYPVIDCVEIRSQARAGRTHVHLAFDTHQLLLPSIPPFTSTKRATLTQLLMNVLPLAYYAVHMQGVFMTHQTYIWNAEASQYVNSVAIHRGYASN
jgi:hypothetical protein